VPFDTEYIALYDFQDKATFRFRRAEITATALKEILSRNVCVTCLGLTASFDYQVGSYSYLQKDLAIPVFGPTSGLAYIPNQAIGRLIPRLAWNKLDSPVDPRSGFAGDFRFELGLRALAFALDDASNFYRILTTNSAYLDLGSPFNKHGRSARGFGGPFVLAFGANLAIAKPFLGSPFVPYSETLAYGGDLSVRGLQERASAVGFPGANYMLSGSLELRWYLYQNPVAGSIQVAPLVDIGFASYSFGRLFREPTLSTGLALRYVSPVGPVSIAYAVPVVTARAIQIADAMRAPGTPAAAPPTGRVHFYFGYSF
jgi:outer membrane protein assembly factor BamA